MRTGCITAAVVVLVIGGLLALAGIWAFNKVTGLQLFSPTGCTITSGTTVLPAAGGVSAGASTQASAQNGGAGGAGTVSLSLDQAQNAATISAVGLQLGVPEFGIEIAEATAIQESKLVNIDYGDRDSLGLFQQRPSQGWGTATEIMNPIYSSTAFYQALLKVQGWQSMPVTVAAQDVQHSADPTAYAQHQGEAAVLAAVFSGAAGPGVACALDNPAFPTQTKAPASLLTARGQTVLNTMRAQFGSANVGPVGSIAADGLSFSVSPPSSVTGVEATDLTWAYANWAAAQAEYLGVAQVGCDGQTWSASAGSKGWLGSGGATTAAASTSGPVLISVVSS